MKKFVFLLAAACCSFSLLAQVATSPVQKFPLRGVFNLSPENDVWKPALLNQQLPKPHPGADRLEVERLKQEKNELAVMIHPVSLKAWMNLNAAKEGKPSV